MDINAIVNLPSQVDRPVESPSGVEGDLPSESFANTLKNVARQQRERPDEQRENGTDATNGSGALTVAPAANHLPFGNLNALTADAPLSWANPQLAQRFESLAQALLDHPGAVPLVQAGAIPPGLVEAMAAGAAPQSLAEAAAAAADAPPDSAGELPAVAATTTPVKAAVTWTQTGQNPSPRGAEMKTQAAALATAGASESVEPTDAYPDADGAPPLLAARTGAQQTAAAFAVEPPLGEGATTSAAGGNSALPSGFQAALGSQLRDTNSVTHLGVKAPLASPQWAGEFGQHLLAMVQNNDQQVSLHLNPASLGPLVVDIDLSDQRANFHFSAHNPQVRTALENALPQLRELLAEQGISLGEAMVGEHRGEQQREFAQQHKAAAAGGPAVEELGDRVDAPQANPVALANSGRINLYI
ncbi:flagellar hook-length control protein FliK [Porticoccus sp.]